MILLIGIKFVDYRGMELALWDQWFFPAIFFVSKWCPYGGMKLNKVKYFLFYTCIRLILWHKTVIVCVKLVCILIHISNNETFCQFYTEPNWVWVISWYKCTSSLRTNQRMCGIWRNRHWLGVLNILRVYLVPSNL